jgi:hypothetical protein
VILVGACLLPSCSLFARFDGFTPDGNSLGDAGTTASDALPVAVGDGSLCVGDGGTPQPGCGDPTKFFEDFERAEFQGTGSPPRRRIRVQGGGAIAISSPAVPLAVGSRSGEFSVTARDGGPPPDSGAFEYSSATAILESVKPMTRYVDASEFLWLDALPAVSELAEVFTLESTANGAANSRILVQLLADQTLFSQSFVGFQPERPSTIVGTTRWPTQMWTRLEVNVDLVARTAVLKRDGASIASLTLQETVAGDSTLLAGISYYGGRVHGPFKLRLDTLRFQMTP